MEKEITEQDREITIHEAEIRPLPEYINLTQEQKDTVVWGLFDWLAHGGTTHRMWLFQAIYSYFHRTERPKEI